MARILFIALVVALVAVVKHVAADHGLELPDENQICLEQAHDEILVTLDNTHTTVPVARRCYKQGSSVLTLKCDFDAQQFQLTLNSTAFSDKSKLLDRLPYSLTRGGASMGNKASCSAAVWTNENVLLKTISFKGEEDDVQQAELSIVDGRAYYKYSVYLSEELFGKGEDCRFVSKHDTEVILSCCADPLPAQIVQVAAPLIGECNIDDCRNSNFKCDCFVRDDNTMEVKLNTTGGLIVPADIDYELVGLTAVPVSHADTYQTPISLYPASASGTGLHQCAAQSYGSHNMVIHNYEDSLLAVTCDIKYCAKAQASVTADLPLCKPSVVPKPEFCPASI